MKNNGNHFVSFLWNYKQYYVLLQIQYVYRHVYAMWRCTQYIVCLYKATAQYQQIIIYFNVLYIEFVIKCNIVFSSNMW